MTVLHRTLCSAPYTLFCLYTGGAPQLDCRLKSSFEEERIGRRQVSVYSAPRAQYYTVLCSTRLSGRRLLSSSHINRHFILRRQQKPDYVCTSVLLCLRSVTCCRSCRDQVHHRQLALLLLPRPTVINHQPSVETPFPVIRSLPRPKELRVPDFDFNFNFALTI